MENKDDLKLDTTESEVKEERLTEVDVMEEDVPAETPAEKVNLEKEADAETTVEENTSESPTTGTEVVEETSENQDNLFRFVAEDPSEVEKITAPRYSYWKSVFRVFFKKKTNWVAIAIFIIMLLMAYIYGSIVPFAMTDYEINPNFIINEYHNLNPSEAINTFGFSIKWILGTGKYGQSMFDYIWASSRMSLTLSILCAAINMTVGIIIGAIWGFSKKVDAVMMEVYNVIANIPYILLVSVMVMILGHGFWSFVIALTITGWLGIAYFIRTQVLIIRDREYNLASKCLGTGTWKITIHNILPFMTSVIVTIIATEVPSYISYEVFLSYLGIGFDATTPSLGRMISNGEQMMAAYPYQFWAPVAVAALLTIILYVVGQNLADASDPRTHM